MKRCLYTLVQLVLESSGQFFIFRDLLLSQELRRSLLKSKSSVLCHNRVKIRRIIKHWGFVVVVRDWHQRNINFRGSVFSNNIRFVALSLAESLEETFSLASSGGSLLVSSASSSSSSTTAAAQSAANAGSEGTKDDGKQFGRSSMFYSIFAEGV